MSEASNRYVETFRNEAQDLLEDIEEAILDVEENDDNKDAINRLFRAMHTIKGSGAMFGFDDIAKFTHHVETALDRVREGFMAINKQLIDLILASRDQIKAMLDDSTQVDTDRNEQIIAALQTMMEGDTSNAPESSPDTSDQPDDDAKESSSSGQCRTYRVNFNPGTGLYAGGMDPLVLLEELNELGQADITTITDNIPLLDELVAEDCYLSWDIILETDKGEEAIRDVFIFVEGDSDIKIKEIEGDVDVRDESPAPRIGEILVERGDVAPDTIDNTLTQQKHLGEMLVENGAISKDRVKAALKEQQTIQKHKSKNSDSSVRVPSDKLDKLINLVGELVITQAQLSQICSQNNAPEWVKPVEEVERLTGELRDNVLNIRMMPIGTTFNRFRRLVRDLASELNKEINLVTEGAETELDKTVIEKLGDPLVHLIRNSIDHGIEQPDMRQQAGKDPQGTIRLSAAHKGASVVITIEDDGKGLDSETIRRKGLERGLISPDDELSEKEIFGLIMNPGFSTAEKVTSVSGRGVGMDVVKREIENLRGTIEITSHKGQGTRIDLTLPLTLAIIDGMLVDVAGDQYVIPVSVVEECIELTQSTHALDESRNMIQVRGELIPYIRLRQSFEITGEKPAIEETVVVNVNDQRLGLVVDRIIGDYQTVIKSLGKLYQDVEGISGATIMGDGCVALILDVNGLLACAEREEQALLV